MKKARYFIIPLCLVLMLTSCGRKNKKSSDTANNGNTDQATTITEQNSDVTQPGSDLPTPEIDKGDGDSQKPINGDILKSIEADIDNDGKNESIYIVRAPADSNAGEQTAEFEGRLVIRDGSEKRDILIARKADSLTGLISDITVTDLDGDGVKDIFIVLPETGNPFTLNYFFMYNYKADKPYSFSTDNRLTAFARSFKFNYKGKGDLDISNDKYNFKAIIKLSGLDDILPEDDETNKQYNNSWVEPIPSEMGSDSKLELVQRDGRTEIKVPFPIFGISTSDVVGEVDVFYSVNKDFTPTMTRFEVLSFNGSAK